MILIAASKTVSQENDNELSLKLSSKQKQLLQSIKSHNKKQLGEKLKIKGDILDDTYLMYKDFGKVKSRGINMYNGLAFRQINNTKKKYLSNNVFIISAFYGIINAHEPVSRYRLDFSHNKFLDETLYSYWREDVIEKINSNNSRQLLNLCSLEYFNVVDESKIKKKIYHIASEEKVPSATLKKIRGEILNYCINNNIKNYRRLIGVHTPTITINSLEKNVFIFTLNS